MAVYTSITFDDLNSFLRLYELSNLKSFKGISAGVTNTNYFVQTDSSKYILTIFEHSQSKDILFYVNLMSFLAKEKVKCPAPIKTKRGDFLGIIKDKPALLVSFLDGKEINTISRDTCCNVGEALAELHKSALDYKFFQENPRGLSWMNKIFVDLNNFLPSEEIKIISDELQFLDKNSSNDLPSGIIHADLFRDNILFKDNRISGIIDFYYACHDSLIYDIAITINDWCIGESSTLDLEKKDYFLKGYNSIRSIEDKEQDFLPYALRFSAMRFWLSRLYDFYFRKDGEMTSVKPPEHFKKILQYYRNS